MDPSVHLDALAQAQWVREKRLSPSELVDAAIARIEKLNPRLNAVITPLFEEARQTARNPLPEGPFRGVPFLLKDLLALLQGVPMSAGSNFLQNWIPDHDSALVTRFKKSGFIILGKTNTCEFGQQPTTEPKRFGPTRNPWDPSRIAGGSSGGSAAAVASGMVAAAHGNDGGGSIRIPASCCGIFGLKPTRGRITLGPDMGDILSGMVAEHVLTRSVRDSAAILDAVAGPEWGDPYFPPAPERPFLLETQEDPRPLRIAFTVKAPTHVPIHPDCIAAVQETARLLSDLGHQVEERDIEIDAETLTRDFLVVWTAGAANALAHAERVTGKKLAPELFETLTWALREWGIQHSAVDYLQALGQLQFLSRQIMRHYAEIDLWLTPTLGEPPLRVGELDSSPEDPLRGFFRAVTFVPFTPLCNITGQPAMSVPLHWNAENLPIGVHFMGRYGDEATLFRLGAQLERAKPWMEKFPPISAWTL